MLTLGQKLKLLREEKDMKQAEVVREINRRYERNISEGKYSKWERDLEVPRIWPDIVAVLRFHRVSADYLLDLTTDRKGGVERWQV